MSARSQATIGSAERCYLRSDIVARMNAVRRLRRLAGLSQHALAARAGTSQPTIAAYEAGTKSPTLRTLERLAESCGLSASISFVPPLTREERRSLYLHEAIAGKIAVDPSAALARARVNVTTMENANPHARVLLDEWRSILDSGVERVLAVLADAGMHARELRQVTPFAGLLTTSERAQVYRRFERDEWAA
jgi:transcriptional regulator with XRE-family HTH domain